MDRINIKEIKEKMDKINIKEVQEKIWKLAEEIDFRGEGIICEGDEQLHYYHICSSNLELIGVIKDSIYDEITGVINVIDDAHLK